MNTAAKNNEEARAATILLLSTDCCQSVAFQRVLPPIVMSETNIDPRTTSSTQSMDAGSLDEADLFEAKMRHLDRLAKRVNPFYDFRCSLRGCHGIAKAIRMLYPNGRQTSSKPPSQATIDKVRRFLKVKVKRCTQDNDTTSLLPTVEQLMLPGLFEADLSLRSHIRICGKEYLDPSILHKTIWLAVCALNLQAELVDNPNAQVPKNAQGQFVATIQECKIPDIAHWLMTYCVIPGGPWAIHEAVQGGLQVSSEEADRFAKMQARLLQKDSTGVPGHRNMKEGPTTVKIVHEW